MTVRAFALWANAVMWELVVRIREAIIRLNPVAVLTR